MTETSFADELTDGITEEALKVQRQRIADYLLDQLLGAGRNDDFDVTHKPSLIRGVAEAIREGRYQ